MARPKKKRKYTKRSAFWTKPTRFRAMANEFMAGRIESDKLVIASGVYPARLKADNPRNCIRAFERHADAAKFGQPYVCATCGEWHARLRA